MERIDSQTSKWLFNQVSTQLEPHGRCLSLLFVANATQWNKHQYEAHGQCLLRREGPVHPFVMGWWVEGTAPYFASFCFPLGQPSVFLLNIVFLLWINENGFLFSFFFLFFFLFFLNSSTSDRQGHLPPAIEISSFQDAWPDSRNALMRDVKRRVEMFESQFCPDFQGRDEGAFHGCGHVWPVRISLLRVHTE